MPALPAGFREVPMLPRALLLPLGFIVLFCVSGWSAAAEPVDFSRDVRPILSRNCFPCHGPDQAQRASGLRLDRRENAVAKRKNGVTPIVAGSSEQSEVIRRLTTAKESDR